MDLRETMLLALVLISIGALAYAGLQTTRRQRHLLRVDAQMFHVTHRGARENIRPFPPRFRLLPAVFVLLSTGFVYQFTSLPLAYVIALGLMIGVLSYQAESLLADRRLHTIESQLGDAIDLMVGALHAGVSLPRSLEVAFRETPQPLHGYLQETIGRIRLGDDPPTAVNDLARRVPLETFQLFSLTVSAQWWAGGSMARTLSTVGRTIRDRIELTRRIRAQGTEAKASVMAILAVTYAITLIVWQANPDPVESFLSSALGSNLAAGAICLQAIGIVWISKMSNLRF